MKVLIVEDHAPLRLSLDQGLREEGFVVESAPDGEEGLWLARNADPDVIVLDLMLPKLDGLTLLKRLREHDRRTAVLILTARDAVEDRVAGLDLGADDYLPKPFAFDELLARVRALCRRRYEDRSPHIQVGDLAIDTTTRQVAVAGRPIALTPREYTLLVLLAREAPRVLGREEIWQRVYEFHSDAVSNVVDVYIGYLRKKLDDPDGPSRIETIRGYGYRLATVAGDESR
ncbi:MAG: response regulator transcription factor [Planctomycetes bacterium]|nr:response regulator transcription factor [Planctomycetota bacterium]